MSQLNKIVTNFPMSLTDEENRNLALTLSAVVEGGGGGGVANAIWKPAVDQDGLMTWSWDTFPDSARPPESVNIKGPRGESGAPGRDGTNGTNGTNGKDGKDGTDGKNGEDGKTPQIQINSSNAHWEWRYSGASEWTDLGVVASGAVGPQGIPGVSGASGAPGAKGEDGDDGVSPAVTMSAITNPQHPNGGTRVTITDKTHPTGQYFDIFNGNDGSGSSDQFDPSTMSGYGTEAAPYGVDTTVIATHSWVESQHYLTSVPDSYATKEYANNASANALSQASAWVGEQGYLTQSALDNYATETYVTEASANALSEAEAWVREQGFLKSVPAGYATESYANNASANALAESKSWVNQQHFATSADLATRVMVPDSADVDLKNKYLVLRTKADGTVDGWTDFNGQSYSKSEADGRYVQQSFIGNTLSGTGANANNKLGANTDVIPTKAWMEDNYLPTSGGTVSGQLEVHGGSNFDTQFIKLTREGNQCGARIGLGNDTNNGTLALKTFNAQGQNTVQVNVKYNTNNNELVQVQKGGSDVGFLIPAQIHQGSYTPTSADGVLHIVLES